MKLASSAADGQERRVGQRMGRQVALDANAAADRVEAEQQHDERDVLGQHRVGQHRPGRGEVRTARVGRIE